MLIQITLRFAKGYIGEPYWPEREKIITIRKVSGVDRARSEDRRQKTLRAYLDTHGMTMDDYRTLEMRAARPFHTREASDEIVVAAAHLNGLMAQAASLAPSAVRLARAEQIRTILEWEDLATGKDKADGLFERFIRNPLTNQRRLQSSAYVSDVTAHGVLRLLGEPELAPKARDFVAWAGREIGVGAARKLGWGRFEIVEWQPRD